MSEIAAGRRSLETVLGTVAERATRSTAEAPAIAAARTKRIQTGGGPSRRGDRQGGGDRDQGELAEEQQAAAVEAVGEGAAEERGDDQRAELGGADQADEEGRAGDHEHLVGERDQGRLGAEAGDQRARREQAEIARLAQGLDVDRYTG